jgi:hypothetical protein
MLCSKVIRDVAVLSIASLSIVGGDVGARAQDFVDPSTFSAPVTGTFAFSLFSGRPTYHTKDAMVVIVLSEETCKLTVADIDTTGVGNTLFPNKLQTNNRLEAGKVFSLGDKSSPIRLIAGEPETHTIIAQCVTDTGSLVRQTVKLEVE